VFVFSPSPALENFPLSPAAVIRYLKVLMTHGVEKKVSHMGLLPK